MKHKASKVGNNKKSVTDRKLNKMAVMSPSLSITTVNINGLNTPIKSQRMAERT